MSIGQRTLSCLTNLSAILHRLSQPYMMRYSLQLQCQVLPTLYFTCLHVQLCYSRVIYCKNNSVSFCCHKKSTKYFDAKKLRCYFIVINWVIILLQKYQISLIVKIHQPKTMQFWNKCEMHPIWSAPYWFLYILYNHPLSVKCMLLIEHMRKQK